MKRHRVCSHIVMTLLAGCLAMACTHRRGEVAPSANTPDPAGRLDSLMWARADSLTDRLSPDQQLGMLLMPSVYTRSDDASINAIIDYAVDSHVGGLILLKGDTVSARIIADTLRAVGRGDMWLAIDAEWGLGMRLKDAPTYPANNELGATASPASMQRYGEDIAAQARHLGISMVLGPVADIVPEGSHSFLSRRSFGNDPDRVANLSIAYSRGLEDGGVMSVAKHFPGHGGVTADSHRALGVVYKSLNEMQHTDLVPFQRYIDAGLSGIMIGHVAFPAIDTLQRSAAVSESVMTDLLRNDMKFKGLILTDALNMAGAGGASAATAIKAGADMVLSPVSTHQALADLRRDVADGSLDRQTVRDRVRRIIYYRLKFSGQR